MEALDLATSDTQTRLAKVAQVDEELKRVYKNKIFPLEHHYCYDKLFSDPISGAEFDATPQVLLLGQYSTGKTTFISYLLGQDYRGANIGPEPTTDKFIAVSYGDQEQVYPGNALSASAQHPYQGLAKFGVSFLNRFAGVEMPHALLKHVRFIDTPGILSGEKQRRDRGYDFKSVISWFADRSDLILLFFDSHKLDISDEFRDVIYGLQENTDKIRCILNKADELNRYNLLHVHGALMWSMGKIISTPEVLRIYVGSFWNNNRKDCENSDIYDMEERVLMQELHNLPRNGSIRKINELVKRVRKGIVNAYVVSYLKEQMPYFIGKEKKKHELLDDLGHVFRHLVIAHNLSPGDFPDLKHFQEQLLDLDFSKFEHLQPLLLENARSCLDVDLPKLLLIVSQISQGPKITFGSDGVEHYNVKHSSSASAENNNTTIEKTKAEESKSMDSTVRKQPAPPLPPSKKPEYHG